MSDSYEVKASHKKFIEVAEEMLASGQRPTAQEVLKKAASGSMTTCNEALTIWWRDLGRRLRYHNLYPDLEPEAVDLAADLIQKAREVAESEWKQEKDELIEQLGEIQKENSDKAAEIESLVGELDGARSALEDEVSARNSQAESHAEREKNLEAMLTDLESAMKGLEKALSESNMTLKETESRLSEEISARKDVQHENSVLQDTLSGLREETARLGASLSALQERAAEKDAHHKQVVEEKSRIVDELKELVDEQKKEISAITKEKNKLKFDSGELNRTILALEQKVERLNEKLETVKDQHREKVADLKERVAEQKETIATLIKDRSKKPNTKKGSDENGK